MKPPASSSRPSTAPFVRNGVGEEVTLLEASSAVQLRPASAASICSDAQHNLKPPPPICRVSKLARPISAPVLHSLRRGDQEEAKKASAWVALQKRQYKLHQQDGNVRVHKKLEQTAEEQFLLSKSLDLEARMRNIERRKRDADKVSMDQISREFRREERGKKQQAIANSLQVKVAAQMQMQQARQRRKEGEGRQLHQDQQALLECARSLAEEKAEKAAAAEIWRQGVLETTKHLQEQTRLKGIAAKADQERERRITKEYEEMCDRQDAERTAKLKEREDHQARLMALGAGTAAAKQANDDAQAARIDRHWQEKYAAEDAKFKRECAERQRLNQECNVQRKQQLDCDEELMLIQYAKDQRLVTSVAARNKEALARDKVELAAKKVQRKEHQRELLAQINETRARIPVDMSANETHFNLTALALAGSGG